MDSRVVHVLADVALVAAALGCAVFVALYQGLTSGGWRRTRFGQNVMAFMVICALLLGLALVREFADFLDPYLDWLRLASFSMVAVVVWWRVALLIGAQAEPAPPDDPPGAEQEETTDDASRS